MTPNKIRGRETPKDPNEFVQHALKLFMGNKLRKMDSQAYKPEIQALTVHPFEKGFLIGTVLYQGRLEVTPGHDPRHINVRSIFVSPKGTLGETPYYEGKEIPITELESALDAAWEAGYKARGHIHNAETYSPHRPYVDDHRMRFTSRNRAPGDKID